MKVRTKVVGARFYPEELELIRELAQSRGLSLSEQVREAVMLHLLRVRGPSVSRSAKRAAPGSPA
jgi:hypothetical protein